MRKKKNKFKPAKIPAIIDVKDINYKHTLCVDNVLFDLNFYGKSNEVFVRLTLNNKQKIYGPFVNENSALKSVRSYCINSQKAKREKIKKELPEYTSFTLYGSIYYIKIFNDKKCYYKLGFTTNENINKRLINLKIPDRYKVSILKVERYLNEKAYTLEQTLHKKFENEPKIKFKLLESGNSEVYLKDVAKIDKYK